jgi:ferredoxin-thioredoxin reductase catalytic subunit
MTKLIINGDKELVDLIRHQLKENGGYCPCALFKTPDTKCICKDFRDQKEGSCHCGLYIKIKQEETLDAKKMEE